VLVSWLRDLVDVPVAIPQLASALHLAGFELAATEPLPPVPAPPGLAGGQAAAQEAAREDAVIDLEITANRPDCLSVLGIAREVSALYDTPLKSGTEVLQTSASPGVASGLAPAPHTSDASGVRVTIEDPTLCPRYAAAVADVTIGPSPAWLSARLAAAGIRSINNIVDITNYVLIETGHPMHAFDVARLAGPELRVRRARAGEKIKTLDGQDRTLADDMLVIADAERPQAIAGVMGGADSEVSDSTRIIVLESAYFQPASVRRTGKRLALSTEASYRFERGADPEAPARALARACQLIKQVGAGTVRPEWIDARVKPRTPVEITLRHEYVARMLGFVVPADQVTRVLTRLGFALTHDTDPHSRVDVWHVVVPSWRGDVTREIDLVEEIARQYGYDRIPTTFPALTMMPPKPDARLQRDRAVRQWLLSAGFNEAVTFTFIERGAALLFAEAPALVSITNPLSENFAVLRPSLLPGLIDSVAHNRRREQRDIRLFEAANRFTTADGERRAVAIAWTGHASPPHWSGSGRITDVFDTTGVVSLLCEALGLRATFAPATRSYLDPSCAAAVHVTPVRRPASGAALRGSSDAASTESAADASSSREIGIVGQLAPAVADARGLPSNEPIFIAELDLDAVADWTDLGLDVRVKPLPRHPSVVRDISILVNADLLAGAVRDRIRAAAPGTLESVAEFDRYQGKGIPDGQCSLSLRLTFRAPDRTLTDAEVQQAMDAIIAALAAAHGAVLR
jgi:phenylalanyl-tRNA synthetase beta chain